MVNSVSIMAQGPGKRRLGHLRSDDEHVAHLVEHRRYGLFRRKDDLLDKGVAAVFEIFGIFGLAGGEVELLSLCFHARTFTSTEAARWLGERGFAPLIFVPNLARRRYR
jgi:hypothetical protein